nr:AI-2E family transporter [Polycladospora coralii]
MVILAILYFLAQLAPYLEVIFIFIKAVLGPFIIAMIISYLLNPIVNILSYRAVPRALSVLLIYTIFIFSLVILILNTLPLLEEQLQEMVEQIPQWSKQIQLMIEEYNHHGKELLPISVQAGIENLLTRIESGITNYVGNMMGGLSSTINQIFIAFVVPFLSFYMMKDAKTIEKSMIAILPVSSRKSWIRLFRDIDRALGNYIRGQLLVCMVVGILAYIGYLIIGLKYALVLAMVIAVFNVIPYLGPILGAIPAVLVALGDTNQMVIAVLIVNLLVQILEGNVLSPQIVGRTLHLHPLFIILALLVGGQLGGVLGLILAVPVFATGKVIIEHSMEHFSKYNV